MNRVKEREMSRGKRKELTTPINRPRTRQYILSPRLYFFSFSFLFGKYRESLIDLSAHEYSDANATNVDINFNLTQFSGFLPPYAPLCFYPRVAFSRSSHWPPRCQLLPFENAINNGLLKEKEHRLIDGAVTLEKHKRGERRRSRGTNV